MYTFTSVKVRGVPLTLFALRLYPTHDLNMFNYKPGPLSPVKNFLNMFKIYRLSFQ